MLALLEWKAQRSNPAGFQLDGLLGPLHAVVDEASGVRSGRHVRGAEVAVAVGFKENTAGTAFEAHDSAVQGLTVRGRGAA